VIYTWKRSLRGHSRYLLESGQKVEISCWRKQDLAKHNNNILVETTKAFAAHVIGVTVSPNGYTHKDGRQTLETCKFVTCHMSHVTCHKHLKHVNLWHACGGANSSFPSSVQDKNCSCFVSFSFFAHSQKIHQSNLVLTFDKIILSKKKTFLPKSRQWRH